MQYYILFAVFGLCFGSFANVLIYRLPKSQSIITPPSTCTNCGKTLKFYHNIPIISWLILGGKCGFCKRKISYIYPMVELISAILFLVAFINEAGLNEIDLKVLTLSILAGICFILLLCLSIIDIKYKAVPDSILYWLIIFCFMYAFIKDSHNPFYQNCTSMILFAGIFWLLRVVVSYFCKKEAMGSADIFIAAVIGGMLGYKLAIIAIYLSAILTLPFYAMIRKKDYELAFIPFLSIGLFVTYVFSDYFLNLIGYLYE